MNPISSEKFIIGLVKDENGRLIHRGNQYYCRVDVGNGRIENQYVEIPYLFGESSSNPTSNPTQFDDSSKDDGDDDYGDDYDDDYDDHNNNDEKKEEEEKDVDDDLTHEIEYSDSKKTKTEIHWDDNMVKLLVASYVEINKGTSSRNLLKAGIWMKIAQKMQAKGYHVNGEQCRNKWRGLLDRYKKRKDKMNTSGEARGFWRHFEMMDEVMCNNPGIAPVSVASNLRGFEERKKNKSDEECSSKRQKQYYSEDDKENNEGRLNEEEQINPTAHCSYKRSKKNSKEMEPRKRSSETAKLRLKLDEQLDAQNALQERFVAKFEDYVDFLKTQKDN